jgi:hypothetical protein
MLVIAAALAALTLSAKRMARKKRHGKSSG